MSQGKPRVGAPAPVSPVAGTDFPGDPHDPVGFHVLALAYLEHLAATRYAATSLTGRRHHLTHFVTWCEARSLTRPRDLTLPILERYQATLFRARTKTGRPLSFKTQSLYLITLRHFFRWCARNRYIVASPAADLELPKGEKSLPRAVLTAAEAERVLALPDTTTPAGLRDRAILETLYSTGIRRSEAIELQVGDLDFGRSTLLIRLGKGIKDRIVPVGERARFWLDRYIREARSEFAPHMEPPRLFVTQAGQSFTAGALSVIVRRYIVNAKLGKTGGCHTFRHSCATLMLEGGADIRFIQALLGHADLSTTELYTRVSIAKLQEVHAASHPGARLASQDPAGILKRAQGERARRRALLDELADDPDADDEGDDQDLDE